MESTARNSRLENWFLQAHEAWDAGDLSMALELFHECASKGSDSCMLNLGYFHDEGIGTPKDKELAMHWYKKAYRRGNSCSASNIAILYDEEGRFDLAVRWFKRAVKMGDGDAELELAKLYFRGAGVRRSVETARIHLNNAINSEQITPEGREEAARFLESIENDTGGRSSSARWPNACG